jgi:hypothetical protein
MRIHRTLLAVLTAVALLAACGSDDGDASSDTTEDGSTATEPAAGPTELVGLFSVGPGACTADGATGSYFRMVQAGGTAEEGPYLDNGDSPCTDKTWSVLEPGSDGGLITGEYQPQVEPFFEADGTTTATRVISPVKFFAVGFGISTNEVDPQTEVDVPPPTITADGGTLDGDLSAISVSWNNQIFNQGLPKPGETADAVTGTYDPDTGAYTLDWTSPIVGGPFDGFSGIWHLEGTFTES